MKYIFSLLIAILCIYVFSFNTNKIDPVLISEYADQLSPLLKFRRMELKSEFDYFEEKGNYGFIESNKVLTLLNDSLIEIIVETNNSNYIDSIVNGAFLYNTFITGYASISTILNLSNMIDIEYIYLSKPMFQSNDSAAFYSHIYDMHLNNYYGENVIASIIDNGFQVNHYIFENKPYRIKYVWNQKRERTYSPYNFNYGEIIDSSNYQYFSMIDNTGHGTAVLATLASGDSVFTGMMPYSPIIGVNAFATEKGVMDAMAFIDSVCQSRDMPYVLCLPMNHYWGKHNAQDVLDKLIDIIFDNNKRKKAISVSAGNLGDKYIHITDTIYTDKSDELLKNKYCLFNKKSEERADIDIIFDKDLLMRFSIVYNGSIYMSNWINTKTDKYGYIEYDNIKLHYACDYNQMHISLKDNKLYRLIIEFAKIDKDIVIDGYAAQGGYFSCLIDDDLFIRGDLNNTIATPALSKQAIAAGVFVSRSSYNNILTLDSLYQIPIWNSKGNFINSKPDLYAPGKFIISYSLIYDDYSINPYYRLFYGSSFAAAITAGAMGVILGTNPYLTVKNLYSLIKEGLHFVPLYKNGIIVGGYGLLDAYSSFLSTRVLFNNNLSVSYDNKYIEFNILNNKFVFENIEKVDNIQSIKIVNNKKALDTLPQIGHNVYNIHIKNLEDNLIFSIYDTVVYKIDKDIKNINEIIYDIMGRKVDKRKLKTGIYYKQTLNGLKKILIFK